MNLENHISTLFEFYYGVISLDEFMEYFNAQEELKKEFDKVLKTSPPDGYTASEWQFDGGKL